MLVVLVVLVGESVNDSEVLTTKLVLGIIFIVEDGDMESTIKNNSYIFQIIYIMIVHISYLLIEQ